MRRLSFAALAFGMAVSPPAFASDMPGMADMPGMNMPAPGTMPAMAATGVLGAYPMSRDASGSSWQPDAVPHRGIHLMAGDWMIMAHASLAAVLDSQSGPRGDSQGFAQGWGMVMARRDFAGGDTVNLRAMLSLDPFMGRRGYPSLLASGETADGVTPLLDRQHPHDLLMELSASYAHRLADDSAVFVYFGYPGEPALGPTAFMHRVSAADNPLAPIAHHWLDSTHIAFGVATAGFVQGAFKLEVSQFTGREPDQFRFDVEPARFDSTALRLSWNPSANWSLQASWGFIKSPEQLAPAVNETRTTASATYVMPLDGGGSLAATLAFGRKQLTGGVAENGFLAEATYKPADAWTIFARAESVESDELFAAATPRTVGELTLGAIHDWRVAEHLKLGLGGLYTFDFVPAAATPLYGGGPHGAALFVRLVAD